MVKILPMYIAEALAIRTQRDWNAINLPSLGRFREATFAQQHFHERVINDRRQSLCEVTARVHADPGPLVQLDVY